MCFADGSLTCAQRTDALLEDLPDTRAMKAGLGEELLHGFRVACRLIGEPPRQTE